MLTSWNAHSIRLFPWLALQKSFSPLFLEHNCIVGTAGPWACSVFWILVSVPQSHSRYMAVSALSGHLDWNIDLSAKPFLVMLPGVILVSFTLSCSILSSPLFLHRSCLGKNWDSTLITCPSVDQVSWDWVVLVWFLHPSAWTNIVFSNYWIIQKVC